MNSEYALNSCKNLLETHLTSMILLIENETGATYNAPTPKEFHFGERETDIMTDFPSIQIIGRSSNSVDDQYNYQDRSLKFEVIAWIIEEDVEKLCRYILRYADAITKCLRKEDYWDVNLHNPVSSEAVYSGLYRTDFGLAKGCLINGSIDYIIT